MDDRRIFKTILTLVGLLIFLQLLRMGIEHGVLLFVHRTYFTYDIATMIAMLLLIIVFVVIASVKHKSLSVFPDKFGWFYIIESLLLISLLVSTPFITGDKTLPTIIMMVYGSVVTPIFEEIIFRGYLWNQLNAIFKRESTTYMVNTLLFAIWHLGYIEKITYHAPNGIGLIMMEDGDRSMFWHCIGWCSIKNEELLLNHSIAWNHECFWKMNILLS